MVFSVRKGVGFDFDANLTQRQKTQNYLTQRRLTHKLAYHFDGILTLFPKRNTFQILVYFWYANGRFLWLNLVNQNGTKHPIS